MKLLVLYAAQDLRYFEQFDKHTTQWQRNQGLNLYHKGGMTAGDNIVTVMQQYLQQADVVVLLLSADFWASDECYNYALKAMEMGKKIVPLIVRPCAWDNTPFAQYSALLPQAISQYDRPEDAWHEAVRRLLNPTNNNNTPNNNNTTPTQPATITWWQRYWKQAISVLSLVGIGVAFLGNFSQFTGYSLRDIWGGEGKKEPNKFAFTVYAKDEGGNLISAINNNREIRLSLADDELHQPIDVYGKATFRLAPQYLNQTAKISILRKDETEQPYQTKQPDSIYTIAQEGKVDIVVMLANLERAAGIVHDFKTNQPIEGVEVMLTDIGTFDIKTTTDAQGRFVLNIPKPYQRKFQNLSFAKKGYHTQTLTQIPIHTQQDIMIQLEK